VDVAKPQAIGKTALNTFAAALGLGYSSSSSHLDCPDLRSSGLRMLRCSRVEWRSARMLAVTGHSNCFDKGGR
jgi:hypothetical protein